MGIDFGKLKSKAARERDAKARPLNPEVPPELTLGDIGFVVPELDALDREVTAWLFGRFVRVAIGIIGVFVLVVIVLILLAWWLGALGFR